MEKIIDIAKKFQISQEEIIELVKIFYGSDE